MAGTCLCKEKLETPRVLIRSYDDMGLEREKILPSGRPGNASDAERQAECPEVAAPGSTSIHKTV